jgi:hypothetical protein
MSIISIEQFEELSEAYPELAQCYDHIHQGRRHGGLIAYTS